ncbi:MAG: NAD-dependent epimerase/dehydratase family protein [Rhodospirillales bacterium]|nr:NAD-dependent epimerase/dehydratase family protein [Rhodospirillales bacterium]MBO6787681.1 NAD-dependent epimerase/dehydratase family protein [Rhodospirillales bacterium]
MKIGVTGANGFVGGYLLPVLRDAGHDVTALVRRPESITRDVADRVVEIPGIDGDTDAEILERALAGLDVVVHLAAQVHVMDGSVSETEFRHVNVAGSVRLFEAARTAGVKRFIFISSVKAAGERSGDTPLNALDAAAPEDAYGRSKRDAEIALSERSAAGACELVILRPAFVYGWPPAGNFRTVISAVQKGLPLPLAGIRNRRDMTYAGNLASAISAVCVADGLQALPYFVADGAPISTPGLFRAVGTALGRPARLFPFPLWSLRLLGRLTGRRTAIARLTENFLVDSTPLHRDARWQPPYKMSEGLDAVATAWREANQAGSD